MKRYSRQILLKDFGLENQQKLSKARVLIVGLGGLGCPVVSVLSAMGVGNMGVMDNDVVDMSNLHRQLLYTENDIGKYKTDCVKSFISHQNSEVFVTVYADFLDQNNADYIKDYDLVVDCTDSIEARYLINDFCIKHGKPFIYGGIQGYEGQVSVFNYKKGAVLTDLYPIIPKENELEPCSIHGVLGVLPQIIGSFQANEAIKVITGIGEVISNKLLIYNSLFNTYSFFTISLTKN